MKAFHTLGPPLLPIGSWLQDAWHPMLPRDSVFCKNVLKDVSSEFGAQLIQACLWLIPSRAKHVSLGDIAS